MKTFKKLSAILLALMLIASCLSGMPTRAAAADNADESTAWYGDGSATTFTLSTLADFKGFVTLSQTNTFEGKTIALATDIAWTGDWAPIGDSADGFKGVFDGQGHTVSGIHCKNSG